MPRSIFITATDTGAGKTWVTAALIKQLLQDGVAAQALKPLASGVLASGMNEDVEVLLAAQNKHAAKDINFHTYINPLAPALAANIENTPLNTEQLLGWVKTKESDVEVTLIEGVGGLMVPLLAYQGQTWLVSDWLAAMPDMDVVLVAPLRLGCMNHILLSCALLMQLDRAPKWIVLNDMDGNQSAEETAQILMPFLAQICTNLPSIIHVKKDGDVEGIL